LISAGPLGHAWDRLPVAAAKVMHLPVSWRCARAPPSSPLASKNGGDGASSPSSDLDHDRLCGPRQNPANGGAADLQVTGDLGPADAARMNLRTLSAWSPGVMGRRGTFSTVSVAGQKPYAIWPFQLPVWRSFSSDAPAWPKRILSGHAGSSYYAASDVARRASVSR